MSDYILEVENMTKDFPGVRALENVSFKVKKGEIHSLYCAGRTERESPR